MLAISRRVFRAAISCRTGISRVIWWQQASLYTNARDLSVCLRAHLTAGRYAEINRAFADVNKSEYQRVTQTQNIAWVTDRLKGQNITCQLGYIGGYSAFVGFDKQAGNAIVVLQNAFNWSHSPGITLQLNLAEKDR